MNVIIHGFIREVVVDLREICFRRVGVTIAEY